MASMQTLPGLSMVDDKEQLNRATNCSFICPKTPFNRRAGASRSANRCTSVAYRSG